MKMRGTVLILAVVCVLAAASSEAVAQAPTQKVQFHFASMKGARTGVVTLVNVRAFVGSAQLEAEEAELSMADGRLRLALKGGGTVTLLERAEVEVVTGPYDRLQRDELLTIMLKSFLVPLPPASERLILALPKIAA